MEWAFGYLGCTISKSLADSIWLGKKKNKARIISKNIISHNKEIYKPFARITIKFEA